MSFKMPVTTADGIEHPDALWRPAEIRIDRANRVVSATFRAWHDAAKLAAGRAPLAGVERSYFAGGADFDRLFAEHIAPNGPNIAVQVYRLARATKDEPAPDGTEFRSYFETAEDDV